MVGGPHGDVAGENIVGLIHPIPVAAVEELGRLAALGQPVILAFGLVTRAVRHPVAPLLVEDTGESGSILTVQVGRRRRW